MKLAYLTVGLIFVATPMVAHDKLHLSNWIQKEGLRDPHSLQVCCGEDDCRVLKNVRISREGYVLPDTLEVIPFSRAIRNNYDSSYWRCERKRIDGSSETRCLIVPPSSM